MLARPDGGSRGLDAGAVCRRHLAHSHRCAPTRLAKVEKARIPTDRLLLKVPSVFAPSPEPFTIRPKNVAGLTRRCYKGAVLKAVTLAEIEKIFTVMERHGISREEVVIPLRPASPGGVRRLPGGKLEITVDGEVPIDEWLETLDARLRALQHA
jgi:hypothetical protein